ncbi:MAG: HEAT repeat domain-containing protein [Pirellulaceae bacterium]
MQRFSRPQLLLILFLAAPLLAGCAEGPLWRTGNLSPWVRQKWADEEKQYGATLRTKLNDLDALASRAGSMSAEDRNKWSSQLAHLANNDPSPLLRARVVEVLPRFPSPTADVAMQKAMGDQDPGVRIAACTALAKRGGGDGLQLVSQALEDKDLDVRLAAIHAIGQFKDPQIASQAVRTLGVALEDKDPAIQYRAIESLRNVSGRDYGNNLVAWRTFVEGGEPVETPPSFVEQIRSWF